MIFVRLEKPLQESEHSEFFELVKKTVQSFSLISDLVL